MSWLLRRSFYVDCLASLLCLPPHGHSRRGSHAYERCPALPSHHLRHRTRHRHRHTSGYRGASSATPQASSPSSSSSSPDTPTHKRHRGASRRIVSHTASIVYVIVFVIAWVLAGLPEYQSAQLGAQRGIHRLERQQWRAGNSVTTAQAHAHAQVQARSSPCPVPEPRTSSPASDLARARNLSPEPGAHTRFYLVCSLGAR